MRPKARGLGGGSAPVSQMRGLHSSLVLLRLTSSTQKAGAPSVKGSEQTGGLGHLFPQLQI